ncbi:MAG: ArdC family protein [Candidatus Binatus sp.]
MDVYAIVTEKIINLLEQGVVPWRRPWISTGPAAKSCQQETASRSQLFSTFSHEIHVTILADDAPGESDGRTRPQGRGEHDSNEKDAREEWYNCASSVEHDVFTLQISEEVDHDI